MKKYLIILVPKNDLQYLGSLAEFSPIVNLDFQKAFLEIVIFLILFC